jgi:hypothetical protein
MLFNVSRCQSPLQGSHTTDVTTHTRTEKLNGVVSDTVVIENQCNLGTSGASVSSPIASNLNQIAVKLSQIGHGEPRL